MSENTQMILQKVILLIQNVKVWELKKEIDYFIKKVMFNLFQINKDVNVLVDF